MKDWQEVKIKDVCSLINGKAFKPKEWAQNGLPIIRIQNLNNEAADFNYCNFSVEEKYYVNDGDLLFAWSGTPGTSFGAHIWNGGKAVLNQHIFRVLIDEKELNKKFFMYLLNKNVDQYIQKAHGTAGLAHITKGKFEDSDILLPSKGTQDNIVSVLETQLTRLEASIKSLKVLMNKLGTYRQCILKAAFNGDLVEADFEKTPIKDISLSVVYGTSQKAKESGKIPVLRMGNLQQGEIDYSKLKFYDSLEDIENLRLEEGDILFNRTNSPELVGKTSIFRNNNDYKDVVFASYLIRVKVDRNKVMPAYLNYWLNSPQAALIKSQLKTQQVGQANINGTKLKNIEFPYVADLKIQQNIINEIESRFSVIDKVSIIINTSLTKSERLRKSILKAAFDGRLVGC
jgi:type I restriction enzyme S subunit